MDGRLVRPNKAEFFKFIPRTVDGPLTVACQYVTKIGISVSPFVSSSHCHSFSFSVSRSISFCVACLITPLFSWSFGQSFRRQ